MHVRQDVPCPGGLQRETNAGRRPLTFVVTLEYQHDRKCDFCFRFFDLRTRTTAEDAA